MPTRTWFTVKMREETNLVELGQMAKIPEENIATTPKATTNKVATTSRAATSNKVATSSRAATTFTVTSKTFEGEKRQEGSESNRSQPLREKRAHLKKVSTVLSKGCRQEGLVSSARMLNLSAKLNVNPSLLSMSSLTTRH